MGDQNSNEDSSVTFIAGLKGSQRKITAAGLNMTGAFQAKEKLHGEPAINPLPL